MGSRCPTYLFQLYWFLIGTRANLKSRGEREGGGREFNINLILFLHFLPQVCFIYCRYRYLLFFFHFQYQFISSNFVFYRSFLFPLFFFLISFLCFFFFVLFFINFRHLRVIMKECWYFRHCKVCSGSSLSTMPPVTINILTIYWYCVDRLKKYFYCCLWREFNWWKYSYTFIDNVQEVLEII